MKRQAASPRHCLSTVVWICKLAWQVSAVGAVPYKQVKGSRCWSFPFLPQLQLWPSPWILPARSLPSKRGERQARCAPTGAVTRDSPQAQQLEPCVLSFPDVTVLSFLPLVKQWNQSCQDQFPRKGKMDSINWMEGENAEDYSALKEQQ